MRLLITGGSGYVGAMLADQFARRDDVEKLLLVDKEPISELLVEHPNKDKVIFVQQNLGDNLGNNSWQEKAKEFNPDVIIHTAWQIREMYGKKEEQWKMNVTAADNVFDLAFATPSVRKLIHFSTVASYGSFPHNEVDHFFTEEEPFRKSEYLYAEEKRIVEEHLEEKYKKYLEDKANNKVGVEDDHLHKVVVVRPAAITGPRGRYSRIRFGLQSALSGSLKTQKSFIYKIISAMVSFVPVTPKWVRQFIHEDDVNDIVSMFAFNDLKTGYEIFNISPPGSPVFGKDMAAAVNKKMLKIRPWMVRLPFFWFWHLTRGKVPTSPGSWKGYSYPIVVDGSKLTKMYGYQYKYPSKEAFVKNIGRYAIMPKP